MTKTINLSINEEILLSLLRSGMMSPQQYYLETDGSVPDKIVQRAIAMTEDEYSVYLEQATRPDEAKLLINEAFLASSNFKFIELPIERLPEVSDLMKRVYLRFNDKDGTEASKRVFIEITAPEMFKERLEARDKGSTDFNMWVCIDEACDKIVGVLSATEDLLDCLFVDGDYHNKGIALRLFKIMLEYFNPEQVNVYASLYAADFYRKLGFVGDDVEVINYGTKVIMMLYKRNAHAVLECFMEFAL